MGLGSGFGFRVWVQGLGLGSGFRVQDSGYRGQGQIPRGVARTVRRAAPALGPVGQGLGRRV